MPSTNPMLARLEPKALPTARPPALLRAALTEMIISGAEVPIETTVKPMIIDEIPKLRATPTLPVTNLSAPQIRPKRPANRAIIGR